jgi:hypothetical protein
VFALIIQMFDSSVRAYAMRVADAEFGKHSSPLTVERCTTVGRYVYVQLSFLFGIGVASVSCVAQSLGNSQAWVSVVAGACFIVLLMKWGMHWRDIPASEIEGRGGKVMRFWVWVAVLVQWAMAVAATADLSALYIHVP